MPGRGFTFGDIDLRSASGKIAEEAGILAAGKGIQVKSALVILSR